MSISACAEIVSRADPDRFMAVMAGPVAAREGLFPLYAFNIEVARAAWVSAEPMIGEMRLQWWRDVWEDAIKGDQPRAHEVAEPLSGLIRRCALPVEIADQLIEARRADLDRAPFSDRAMLDTYLAETGGGLMVLAGRAVGAGPESDAALADLGWAAGLAGYLRAVPELEARGRQPLPDGRPAAVIDLANAGLERIKRARQTGWSKAARPAAVTAWQTHALLSQVVREPGRVAGGSLGQSEFARRGSLLRAALTGRV